MAQRCVCCGESIPEVRQVCPNCEKVLPKKPMTNEDHFRDAISTEEGLVTFLMKAHDGEINIPFCRSDVVCKGEDDPMGEGCRACMMAYLNSPAEEG